MECPTDDNVRAANKGPLDSTPSNATPTAPDKASLEERLRRAAELTDRLLGEEQLAEAAATTEAPPTATPTKSERTLARVVGKRVIKFLDLAKAGQDKAWAAADDALKLVNGTTIADSTFWMNFQNAMSEFFVNSRAKALLFFDLYAHEEGKLGYQNSVSQAFNQMIPKIRGMHQIFVQRQEGLQRSLIPYMRRTGRSTSDIAVLGGDYLNCLHAPERNAHLLDVWERQVAENEQLLQGMPEQEGENVSQLKRQTTLLRKRIDNLKANLDNPNPPADLVTGGYTNGQAKARMEMLEKSYGLTKEEWTGIAKRISDEFNYITEEQVKAGLIPQEQVAAFPNFQFYAPQMTDRMNLELPANDASHYVPGSRHAANGMKGTPVSAFITLGFAAKRAASEIGSQDFGQYFVALERKMQRVKDANPDFVSPILSYDDKQLSAMLASGNRDSQAIAQSIRQNNGMVINAPMTAADGTRYFDRRYYYFNPRWSDGRLNGNALNEALSGNLKLGAMARLIGKTTSYYGQSFTRFSPPFAPVAALRDIGERVFHLANRDYIAEDGTRVEGSSLVKTYAANVRRAGSMLMEAMRGKAEEGSQAAQYFDEFRRSGLQQKYLPDNTQERVDITRLDNNGRLVNSLQAWKLDKQAEWLKGKNLGPANRVLNEAGEAGKAALRVLDGWNDWCQNVPAFTHYITLREAGVSPREAAYGVREIIDMSQSGKIANYLSVIAPFVRPTMQGAAAFARTMGLAGRNKQEIFESGKKGWITGLTASMVFSVLYPLARESMGTDETGRPYMDSLPVSRLTNFLPIGIGDDGSYIKLPMGFGPVRVAAALALSMDRVSRGLMEPSDAVFEVLFAAARDTVPGNNPMFNFSDKPAEFISQYIVPAAAKPFVELATNTNAFGNAIQATDRNSDKPQSDQGFTTTPAIWHRIARWAHKEYGVDFTPEAYRHIAKGMAFGPLRLITSGIVNYMEDGEVRKGFHKPTAMEELGPALTTLGLTTWYGKVRDTSQHYYYQASDELMKKAKRAGVDMTQDGKTGAEGDAIVEQKLLDAGLDEADVEDILRLRSARKLLRSYGKAFNKAHQHWYDEEDATPLKDDFETLYTQSEEVYKDFIQNANYYR